MSYNVIIGQLINTYIKKDSRFFSLRPNATFPKYKGDNNCHDRYNLLIKNLIKILSTVKYFMLNNICTFLSNTTVLR